MKKAALIMVMVTLLFCAFSAGFFLGRGAGGNRISVSAIPTGNNETEAPSTATDPTEESLPFPLDINTATVQELILLPGIGEKLAANIIAYRNENGPFETLADLTKVDGVGEKKLEAILDYITIGGQP